MCDQVVERGHCQAHAVVRERARLLWDVRKWYRTKRWKLLRREVLRDNPLCVDCQMGGYVTPATDVDHRIPHRGDARRFWDRANLQGLCASHHSAKTERGE